MSTDNKYDSPIRYSQYFDQGNFRANKHWDRNFKPFGDLGLEVPPNILDRLNTNEPFRRFGASIELGRYEAYIPDSNPELDPKVLVARNPLYPLQRIVGPQPFIEQTMFAYYLLDHLYENNPFHHMDIVASVRVGENGLNRKPGKFLWTKKLLSDLDIQIFSEFQIDYQNPIVGILTNVNIQWPLFFNYCDIRKNKPNLIKSLQLAEGIVHDYSHIEQARLSPVYGCTKAERQAMSNQLRLAESFFNYPGFFEERDFVWESKKGSKNYAESINKLLLIFNSFKTGGSGHLSKTPGFTQDDIQEYADQSSNFTLPIEDFR